MTCDKRRYELIHSTAEIENYRKMNKNNDPWIKINIVMRYSVYKRIIHYANEMKMSYQDLIEILLEDYITNRQIMETWDEIKNEKG